MIHKCRYCDYESAYRPNMKRHMKNKHGNHLNSVQPAETHKYPSNPHPYVHPYLNHANQQPNPYPQRTAEMVHIMLRKLEPPQKLVLVLIGSQLLLKYVLVLMNPCLQQLFLFHQSESKCNMGVV